MAQTDEFDDLNLDEAIEVTAEPSPAAEPAAPSEPDFPDPIVSHDETEDPSASDDVEPPHAQARALTTPPAAPSPASSFDTQPSRAQTTTYDLPIPPQPAFKFYGRSELQQAVDQGVINENQMADQLELQTREQLRVDTIRSIQESQIQQRITAQLSEYETMIPGWRKENSPANQKAVPEYSRLLSMGLPNSDATRLLALENTFGTLQRLKESRAISARTTEQRSTPPASGRRGGAPPSTASSKDILKALPKDQLRAYKELIDKGLYKGWSEVRKEVEHGAKQTVNARLREKTLSLTR